MDPPHQTDGVDGSGLRERNVPQQAYPAADPRGIVQDLNDEKHNTEKDERGKKTFGRTPDGTGMCCMRQVVDCPSSESPPIAACYLPTPM